MDMDVIRVLGSAFLLFSTVSLLVVRRASRAFDRKYHLDGK